jgi:hypothetical protein|tara:strand:- start:89 stop:871 length:783 start_codon:yes stop_codon:yes gene_type:complete
MKKLYVLPVLFILILSFSAEARIIFDPETLFQDGEKFFTAQPPDYPAAEKFYLEAAEAGHGMAQLRLGFMYAEDHFTGVATDLTRAEYWFLKAAEQDAGDARFRLGVFYRLTKTPPEPEKARHWLRLAAEAGHSAAQYDLAMMCLESGNGQSRDEAQWHNWMEKAAMQDNLHAAIALSRAYQHGLNGLEKDARKSVQWAAKAAEKTKSRLWFRRIGDAYFSGEGNLAANPALAKFWYEKAAKKGDEHAVRRLSEIQNLKP